MEFRKLKNKEGEPLSNFRQAEEMSKGATLYHVSPSEVKADEFFVTTTPQSATVEKQPSLIAPPTLPAEKSKYDSFLNNHHSPIAVLDLKGAFGSIPHNASVAALVPAKSGLAKCTRARVGLS
jgi:hypothetical protein